MSAPTFSDNQTVFSDLERLWRCTLALSAMGAVVKKIKSGPAILIDEKKVPLCIEQESKVEAGFGQLEMYGCRVIWKNIN